MQLTDFVLTIGSQWKKKYQGTVRKLSLSGPFSCPNRDGTIGRGGCTFCNVSSFSETSRETVADQIASQKLQEQDSVAYFAYFQSYTSTYAEISYLKYLYDEALCQSQVVGLCVGTRPDCVSDSCLDLLESYQDQGKEVILELGLQSALDRTLHRVNRGHDFAAYAESCRRSRKRGINVCTHLILGLPGETFADNLETLNKVLDTGVDALKLHPLHIVTGSVMAREYQRGSITLLDLDEYVMRAGELVARTPSHIVFHRLSATARRPTLIAPDYCERKFTVIDRLTRYLSLYGCQGSALGDPYLPL